MISVKTFGIVGSKGAFGTLLDSQLTGLGYTVIGCDIDTDLTLEDIVSAADVVIFCVPIDKTVSIITQANTYSRQNQLFIDITSIKSDPVQAMLQSKAFVIGTHPMFGPFVGSFKSQIVVVTPARDTESHEYTQFIQDLFIKLGATIETTTPEKHDKIMGLVQQLTHFLFFTLGLTLEQSGTDFHDSLKFVSPVYRVVLSFLGRILHQNPELYYQIQKYNGNTLKNIDDFVASALALKKIIADDDSTSFIKKLRSLKEFVGDEELAFSTQLSDRIVNLNSDLFDECSVTLKARNNRVGLLADLTGLLRIFDINLRSFHSFLKHGELYFVMSFEKSSSDADLKKALSLISEKLYLDVVIE